MSCRLGWHLIALPIHACLRRVVLAVCFVQPAAGDAGGALGAALHGSLSLGDNRIKPFSSCALGLEANSSRAMRICKDLNINYSLPEDIHMEAG